MARPWWDRGYFWTLFAAIRGVRMYPEREAMNSILEHVKRQTELRNESRGRLKALIVERRKRQALEQKKGLAR